MPRWIVSARPYHILASSVLYIPFKRIMDLLIALCLFLVLLIPTLVGILLLKLIYGQGLFIQKRVGKDGAEFYMYKLASMYPQQVSEAPAPRISTDSRITPIGRTLRRLGLDEIPQLLNVIIGDMSLVGPRPEMPFLAKTYTEEQKKRLQVLPGITGIWQLSGSEVRPLHEHLEHDLWYVEHRSILLDAYILVISPLKVWLQI